MKALLVDDEPLARTRLKRLLAELADWDDVNEAENGEQAVKAWQAHEPDVILMDIRMPVMDGLTAARIMAACDAPPAIIFCTAYSDYAIEAFDTQAVGYLLKPVSREALAAALDKAQRLTRLQLSALADAEPESQRTHLSAQSGRTVSLVAINDVRYLQADHKYVSVFHPQGELVVDESLKELEGEFGDRFIRVHRNALVAVAHIQGTENCEQGVRVKLADIDVGPLVSRRHLTDLRKVLRRL